MTFGLEQFWGEALDIGMGLNIGYEDYDNTRYMLNPGATARADYHNLFISPSLRLVFNHAAQENWELRPSASVSYPWLVWGLHRKRRRFAEHDHRRSYGQKPDYPPGTGECFSAAGEVGKIVLQAGLESRFSDNSELDVSLGGAVRLAFAF